MNVRFPAPPAAVTELVQKSYKSPDGVTYMSTDSDAGGAIYQQRFPRAPEIRLHRQVSIPTSAFKDERPLLKAVQLGWRSIELTKDPNQPIGARLIEFNESTGIAEFQQYTLGPHAAQSCEALTVLAGRSDPLPVTTHLTAPGSWAPLWLSAAFRRLRNPMKSGSGAATYELNFMLIPQLYVAAIWLRSGSGSNIFYPLDAKLHRPAAFDQEHLYGEISFFTSLKALVQRYNDAQIS
jgi:hypothetical protein